MHLFLFFKKLFIQFFFTKNNSVLHRFYASSIDKNGSIDVEAHREGAECGVLRWQGDPWRSGRDILRRKGLG